MAIELRSTADYTANGVKILVYGESGAGKTTLCGTVDSPVIISAEGGLLALRGLVLPYIEIRSLGELDEAYRWAAESEEAAQFQTVCVDSISEIAEVCLKAQKAKSNDGRMAYGDMVTDMAERVRRFRDLPGRDVVVTAWVDRLADDLERIKFLPGAPGKTLGPMLPYLFDEVLALRVERDDKGVPFRTIQTQPDAAWTAKDRSGSLEPWEAPDLGAVIRKIRGEG